MGESKMSESVQRHMAAELHSYLHLQCMLQWHRVANVCLHKLLLREHPMGYWRTPWTQDMSNFFYICRAYSIQPLASMDFYGISLRPSNYVLDISDKFNHERFLFCCSSNFLCHYTYFGDIYGVIRYTFYKIMKRGWQGWVVDKLRNVYSEICYRVKRNRCINDRIFYKHGAPGYV